MPKARVNAITSLFLLMTFILAMAPVAAQQAERPLRPTASQGIPVIPFMEGWYDNADGSVTVSFGYHNRNQQRMFVPKGENNYIEPASLNGMQPEVYYPGRHHGVFAVTLPASMDEETFWWYLNSAGEELKVPGERGSTAYELDRNPRPQGSLQPNIWFEDEQPGSGPEGVMARNTRTVAVGEPLTLEVWTEDPSVRDRSDPRFAKPLDTRVSWYKHQGPGEVTFTEHESMPITEITGSAILGLIPTPQVANPIPAGQGPARVVASFSEPGDYMIRARLDNWKASDSDGLDQCCWSNAYQQVRVTP